MIEQNTIYDYLDKGNDPIYQKLMQLENGDSIVLEGIEVELNVFGLYEVSSSTYFHEGFSDLDRCYKFICEFLEDKILEESE